MLQCLNAAETDRRSHEAGAARRDDCQLPACAQSTVILWRRLASQPTGGSTGGRLGYGRRSEESIPSVWINCKLTKQLTSAHSKNIAHLFYTLQMHLLLLFL